MILTSVTLLLQSIYFCQSFRSRFIFKLLLFIGTFKYQCHDYIHCREYIWIKIEFVFFLRILCKDINYKKNFYKSKKPSTSRRFSFLEIRITVKTRLKLTIRVVEIRLARWSSSFIVENDCSPIVDGFPRISNEFQHSVLFIGSCLGAIRLRNPWNDRLAEVMASWFDGTRYESLCHF